MNLKPRTESITVQNEILKTTQGLIWKVGGITLDGSAFPAGIVKAGTPVAVGQNGEDLAKPWAAEDGETITDAGIAYVTTHDVKVGPDNNAIVGAFEEAYFDKNKVDLSDEFIAASEGRYKLR